MCIYCNKRVFAHIISADQGEDWSPGIAAYIMDGKLRVEVDADACWEYEAPINFCSMCGRDLRGGDAS